MKFLVTGAAGLIGRQVCKDLVESGDEVFAGYHNTKPEFGTPVLMDLSDFDNLKDIVSKIKPDVILHLGAMTNVDLCEKEKDLAMKINGQATEVLAKQAAKEDAFFVYVSTDYVFDGKKGMRKEDDETNPVDYYGESKLAGEKAIQNLTSSWCIARTSTPYGIHPTKPSFPTWVAKNLLDVKEINVIVDQFTSPTYVPNLSSMLVEILKRQIVGIIHLAGATRISRYEMAEVVAGMLNLDKKLLKPVKIHDMKWIAKRPEDSSLDVSKATAMLNEKPQTIKQSINFFIEKLKSILDKT